MSTKEFIWGLLDFRLEKYVTPYILRLYWILAVGMSLLYFITFTLELIVEGRGREAGQYEFNTQVFRELFEQPRSQSREPAEIVVWFQRITQWVFRVVRTVCLLLLVRVCCESIIVVFNMASSLKSIDAGIAMIVRRQSS
jgi:hypothetical protein